MGRNRADLAGEITFQAGRASRLTTRWHHRPGKGQGGGRGERGIEGLKKSGRTHGG